MKTDVMIAVITVIRPIETSMTIDDMTRRNPEDLARAGTTAADVAGEAAKHYDTYARLSDRLCVNLVTYVFDAGRRA